MSYKKYWPMEQYMGKGQPPAEVFKCTQCDQTTHTVKGHNGEPDKHVCTPQCQASHGDWNAVSNQKKTYSEQFDKIFPDSPGAGL